MNIDSLINEAFRFVESRERKSATACFVVTHCAGNVRVTDKNTGSFVQRDENSPHWKAFRLGYGYLCGMDQIGEAFRAIQLVDDVLKREREEKHATSE